MRLISWNVNSRVKCLDRQIEALCKQKPDIVALQEVKENTAPRFRNGLCQIGLHYVIDSFQLADDKTLLIGPRRYGEVIACRWPINPLSPAHFNVPWTERVLSVTASCPWGNIELHTVHIPPGVSNGWVKIETLEGIYEQLAHEIAKIRILCGDFNTPKEEKDNGQIVTWGKEGGRWDLGERNVLEGLSKFDLCDVYRFCHGYGVQEYSWYARPHIGRRFDHVFASRSMLAGVECEYLHSLRQEGLSDHSAIKVDFKPI